MADKKEGGVHRFYKIEDGKTVKLRHICSRCGKGFFMAQHKDRRSCGKCGLTEFNQ
ncbi:ribosomal protein S27AE [Cenarchaeum symbiosum A]|uniref:Small ribosomal subunit protein eS31 n=1 Tax=Cenarchaeum symbiosum (strain A) TaxID=414004 RepID=RS27A_CENSY|nr:RecName: Full=Small ribosomal subunit protein eS31; AltName: Full=30S ribosomal protein S27ae [Cenarchaeum symbiosum A]ABK77060.1 ribosomal protein S27AE [Cenarchaeum symbiosum A]